MIDIEQLGWRANQVGELDHRLLKAPSVKLRSARQGPGGDTIFCVDLRVRRPNNNDYLLPTALHSVEHFLLEGLQRHLPEHFISVGIMGCRTGFYLAFMNEGRADTICSVLGRTLEEVLVATAVPYARASQCGHFRNHSLESAQAVAREILARRAQWLDAA